MSIFDDTEGRSQPLYKGVDQTGQVYGKWTVISRVGTRKFPKGHSTPLWEVRCECGSIEVRQPQSIRDNGKTGCSDCLSKAFRGANSCHWKGGRHVSGYFFLKIKKGASARRGGKGIDFDLTIEYLDSLWESQDGKCKYTKLPLGIGRKGEKTTASIDRIDSSKPYCEGNVQFVHKDVNRVKWDLPEDRFFEICRLVVENNE